jgi:hypothetical protein
MFLPFFSCSSSSFLLCLLILQRTHQHNRTFLLLSIVVAVNVTQSLSSTQQQQLNKKGALLYSLVYVSNIMPVSSSSFLHMFCFALFRCTHNIVVYCDCIIVYIRAADKEKKGCHLLGASLSQRANHIYPITNTRTYKEHTNKRKKNILLLLVF